MPGLDVAPQRPDDARAGGEAGPHVAAGGGAAPRVPGLQRGLGSIELQWNHRRSFHNHKAYQGLLLVQSAY